MRSPGPRARSRRQFLRDDLLKQPGIGRTEGERLDIHALPGEGSVAPRVEGWASLARGLDPGGELLRWHREHVEMHVRETIATIVARKAAEGALSLDARNHQAKAKVAAIVGTTIASMMASESIKIVFWASPTGPCGSRTAG